MGVQDKKTRKCARTLAYVKKKQYLCARNENYTMDNCEWLLSFRSLKE